MTLASLTLCACLGALTVVLLCAPDVIERGRPTIATLLSSLLPVLAVMVPNGVFAYAAIGFATALLGWQVPATSRAGKSMLGLAAAASLLCAVSLAVAGTTELAFFASLASLALRAGLVGLHAGVSSLWRGAPALQVQQYTTLLILVFCHLRFMEHTPSAFAAADAVVLLGAASALGFALIALVQRDLDGLLRTSMLMHGGLMFAAVGAAGRGHQIAALFVSLSMTIAVTGLCLMTLALEARVGKVNLQLPGGRARAFPRLAAAFGFFGAAGVGMPGTAGFIADDLILHALWSESVLATVGVVLASALLAIATLRAISLTFMGPQTGSLAPDLGGTERIIAFVLVLLLLGIGLVPQLIVGASEGLFPPQ